MCSIAGVFRCSSKIKYKGGITKKAMPFLDLDPWKKKSDLSLAPHEWASLYKQCEPITSNGANSIRHLEGCVLILLEKIKERIEKR